MGLPTTNIFSSYQLSSEEELVGQTFNHLQQQYLHNCRTEVAESKLQLKVVPGEEQQFFLDQAFKDGLIAAFTALLDLKPDDNQTTEA